MRKFRQSVIHETAHDEESSTNAHRNWIASNVLRTKNMERYGRLYTQMSRRAVLYRALLCYIRHVDPRQAERVALSRDTGRVPHENG